MMKIRNVLKIYSQEIEKKIVFKAKILWIESKINKTSGKKAEKITTENTYPTAEPLTQTADLPAAKYSVGPSCTDA